MIGFVSLRGESGLKDEPQDELIGQITTSLLDTMRIKWEYLSDDMKAAERQLKTAARHLNKDEPFFFVLKKAFSGRLNCGNKKVPL